MSTYLRLKPLLFYFLLLSDALLSGTTGKLAGRVTDKSSGAALVGVNVIVEGTARGSATDANGDYFILQLSPGTYSVRFSMIGYQPLVMKWWLMVEV